MITKEEKKIRLKLFVKYTVFIILFRIILGPILSYLLQFIDGGPDMELMFTLMAIFILVGFFLELFSPEVGGYKLVGQVIKTRNGEIPTTSLFKVEETYYLPGKITTYYFHFKHEEQEIVVKLIDIFNDCEEILKIAEQKQLKILPKRSLIRPVA